MFVGTCLLCVYTCSCMLLACHLGRWLKYLASCLSPFLKPAVMWPRESRTAADSQGWGVLSLCSLCSPTLQKFRAMGDSKSQLEILLHTWLPWGWEPWEGLKAGLGWCEQPGRSSAGTCHTWLRITFPLLTCQGSNCLCPSCSWGKHYHLPGNGHCCSFQGEESCSHPSRVYVTSLLWFVRVFWFCCCGLSFSFLSSESRSSCWLWKPQPGTETGLKFQIVYLKSGWSYLSVCRAANAAIYSGSSLGCCTWIFLFPYQFRQLQEITGRNCQEAGALINYYLYILWYAVNFPLITSFFDLGRRHKFLPGLSLGHLDWTRGCDGVKHLKSNNLKQNCDCIVGASLCEQKVELLFLLHSPKHGCSPLR